MQNDVSLLLHIHQGKINSYLRKSTFFIGQKYFMFPLSKCEINKFLFVIFQIDITSLAITPVVNYMPVEGRKTNPRSRGG